MNLDKVKELITLLENSNLSEIEITEDKEAIRLTKTIIYQPTQQPAIVNVATPSQVKQPPPLTNAVADHSTFPSDMNKNLVVFKSPMVGIYYNASSPEAKAFVAINETVKRGDILCIIEAMKIFNQIECDIDGKIVNCFVENGQPVEFGQSLFTIEKSKK